MKRVVLLMAIACAIVASSSIDHAGAQSPTLLIDATIASTAPEIVNGVVVATSTVEIDGYPHTIHEVEVTEAVVGERSGSVMVQVPGGTLPDGTLVVVSHQPQLEESDQVQLALGPTEIGVDVDVAAALAIETEVVAVHGGMEGTHWFDGEGISSAQAAGDYVLNGSRWASFPVTYQVNPANSGLAADATIVAVQRAFDRWENDPGSNIDFTYGGVTQLVDRNLGDGVNVVSWVQTNQGWLGEASWSINPASGTILSFDIRMNRAYQWAVGGVPGRFDVETVMGHEIGHAIGLNHTPASSELMFASVQSGTVKPLGLGDRGGARALYPAPGSGYMSLTPARILDTRNAGGSPWGPSQTRSVQVAGVGGVPASGVDSVAVHITTVTPTAAASFLTVWPAGTARPTTSQVSFGTDATSTALVNDLVIARVGSNGRIDIYNAYGSVHLVIDVVGYFAPSVSTGFTGLDPMRILDSRDGSAGGYSTPWSSAQSRTLQVAGRGGVPASGVDSVALHITTVNPSAPYSHLTVWPTGQSRPTTSASNFGTGADAAGLVNNLVITKLGAGGAIDLYNHAGNVHLVIDVVGYFSSDSPGRFTSYTPGRFVDSRIGLWYSTPWGPGVTRAFATACEASLFHATTVNTTAPGSHLTVRPSGSASAHTSVHNFGTAPSASALSTSLMIGVANAAGHVEVRNHAGSVDLVLDAVGGFGC